MTTILDTGPLVALFNRRDAYHLWAVESIRSLPKPFWTCEAVLTEAAHLTKAPHAITDALETGVLRIGLRLDEQAKEVLKLLERYGSRMDLADACIVRMSEMIRDSRVFTLDRKDFCVYRRYGREIIPLIAPVD